MVPCPFQRGMPGPLQIDCFGGGIPVGAYTRERWHTKRVDIPGGIPEAGDGYMGGILRGPVY